MGKPKVLSKISAIGDKKIISEFENVNRVRTKNSELGNVDKNVSPVGVSYTLTGDSEKDSVCSSLFTQYKVPESGSKQIYAYLSNYINDAVSVGKLKPLPFAIPSGQFDNAEMPDSYMSKYDKDDYCHPSIAYDSTGVAGYKYWMMSSVLPQYSVGATWEDEDLFVSNDAITWLRIKSLYEDAKTYTASGLSLPPQTLETVSARKHAFLPCPAEGDQIEISVPADNGGAALDRVTITLISGAFKHDPAIFIDGGYVYTYHTFHLAYADRTGGKNRFIVCVRTNDGVNWESVRSDGSTLPITAESSRQLFTKDAEGRYNYMLYTYNVNYSNPEILKYGENDYEFVYGYNFNRRYKGTTPYNFDFTQTYTFQNVGSGNHPGLLLDGSTLYLFNSEGLYVSSNRGETFTKYDHPPFWLGGLAGMGYKKAACIGASGKVVLIEAQRQVFPASSTPVVNTFAATSRGHQLYVTTYDSVADLVSKAQNGLIDGYIDVQIVKINYTTGKRSARFYPYISNLNTTSVVNSPLQRIKITDLDVIAGDTLYFFITLNARNGAKIIFGGIEIA